MAQAHDRRSLGEYIQSETETELRRDRTEVLSDWCGDCHRALVRDDYDRVLDITATRLLPELNIQPAKIRRHARRVSDHDADLTFNAPLARRALTAAEAYEPEGQLTDVLREILTDSSDGAEELFQSVYALLVVEGIVDGDATSKVPAYEYEHQVGVRYYSPTSNGSSDLEMIDDDGDLKATLFTGGQGSGKSTALETVTEDRLARGHKLIDLVDFLKAENATRDIESQDEEMRDIREEMGLDTGFGEFEPPKMEIRVPLTPDLAEQQVPYDTEAEDYVVKPFVVPASELTYRQLVMILPHVTKTHEQHLQAAHQMLSNSDEDWTLADMAQTVREETNAGETLSDRIERSLETVQKKSFIRDRKAPDEMILDWPEMFSDTDTATAFTFFPLSERSDRLLMASYLLDSLYDERRRLLRRMELHKYPSLTVAIRELHEIVPRGKAQQEAESTIEGYMIDTMSELIALVRHADMELLCDTQKFKQQLSPDVSGLFHRIFAFGGQRPDIKKVFSTRLGSSDANDHAPTVAKFDPGKCALISGDGFRMPIQMAPPRSHHLDAKEDGNGLGFRVRHIESEELRDAPWSADIPGRLAFDDLPDGPIAGFVRAHLDRTHDADDKVLKDEVTQAYSEWSALHDEPPKQHKKIHSWIKNNTDIKDGETRKHDYQTEKKACYKGVKITL